MIPIKTKEPKCKQQRIGLIQKCRSGQGNNPLHRDDCTENSISASPK